MSVKDRMISLMLPQVINIMLTAFPSESVKRALDSAIDAIENQIEKSESKVDDLALPVLSMLRNVFTINDYPDEV